MYTLKIQQLISKVTAVSLLLWIYIFAPLMTLSMINPASASSDHHEETQKTNICHQTSSSKNEWNAQSVSNVSIHIPGHENDYYYNGPVKENGQPTNDGDKWCEDHFIQPTPTPTPSLTPTCTPTPSVTPTTTPTEEPTPSVTPTTTPTEEPTPSVTPTTTPTEEPTPSITPTTTPTEEPTPSVTPTTTPTEEPTPSVTPTTTPTEEPTPSVTPTTTPTDEPTPSVTPTTTPTEEPTPSVTPTTTPTEEPTPSVTPTTTPTGETTPTVTPTVSGTTTATPTPTDGTGSGEEVDDPTDNEIPPVTTGTVQGTKTTVVAAVTTPTPSPEVLGERTCTNAVKLIGVMYVDSNKNGNYDFGEQVFSNITGKVTYNVDTKEYFVDHFISDNNGKWEMTLCPGEYNITVNKGSLPRGIVDSADVHKINVLAAQAETTAFVALLATSSWNWSWWWLVLILFILAVIYYIYRKRQEYLENSGS